MADAYENFCWNAQGFVTPSVSQGACGGCYAFVAADIIISRLAISKQDTNLSKRFSPQQFLDCCDYQPCDGCTKGDIGSCLQWAELNPIHYEENYEYVSVTNTSHKPCRDIQLKNLGVVVATNVKIERVRSYINPTVNAVIDMLNNGPVGAVMDGYKLDQNRTERIWRGATRKHKSEPHAVLIVGHGRSTNGKLYWVVKNSWGPAFGEDGFHRIAFGCCRLLSLVPFLLFLSLLILFPLSFPDYI